MNPEQADAFFPDEEELDVSILGTPILEVDEQDTTEGSMTAGWRRWLETKYGKPRPPEAPPEAK
jgi:hypothetical protein